MDWDAFYKDALGPYQQTAATQRRLLSSDPVSSVGNLSYKSLQEQFGKSQGGLFDFLQGDKSVDPYEIANPAQSPATGTEIQQAPDMLAEIAAWIPRLAIIILGFIFVAVGLSLFRVPIAVAAREGFTDGIKQGVAESKS